MELNGYYVTAFTDDDCAVETVDARHALEAIALCIADSDLPAADVTKAYVNGQRYVRVDDVWILEALLPHL